MRTVFASLPFYDSLIKQDRVRSGAVVPIHCPKTQLPPFLIAIGTTITTVNSIKLVSCDGTETDISGYFTSMPSGVLSATMGRYIVYNGDPLKTLLPGGSYYIKISKSDAEYYSDWIRIMDIYSNLLTDPKGTFSNYNTFTTSGIAITSAIATGGFAKYAESNVFSVVNGEVLKVYIFLTLNSGELPVLEIVEVGGATLCGAVSLTAGINVVSFTIPKTTANACLLFGNNTNANWNTGNIYVIHNYSSKFIRLDFTNSKNLGDLKYENGFIQSVWLEAILNNPTHEMVDVGEEKDGIFIAEKIVSKYIYSVICYVPKGLYNCLLRLSQHDTITITDEVGNMYTPSVGNITVDPAEWLHFDFARLVIKFNDGDRSSFSWVK
jgi:hypothetical protein